MGAVVTMLQVRFWQDDLSRERRAGGRRPTHCTVVDSIQYARTHLWYALP